MTSTDRGSINKELAALHQELTRIAKTTEFNTKNLLNTDKNGFTFQIGANEQQTLTVTIGKMDGTTLLGSTTTFQINSVATNVRMANGMISKIDKAIATVSDQRAHGAVQNRLEHTINNLTATNENLSDANSRIRDVDMAEEMMTFTKSKHSFSSLEHQCLRKQTHCECLTFFKAKNKFADKKATIDSVVAFFIILRNFWHPSEN